MRLSAGARLGPYEIVVAVGAGGMGEVYRARDTRLGRDVAIKALPEEFADDGERLARFEREAKVLAALNHPRIAAIYGLELAAGASFLVLEYVDGESLAQLLKKGALPLSDALDIARQTAEALEAAHEKGIVHRDLKPANIMLTRDGQVKVLDFGLAKAIDPTEPGDFSGDADANSPTVTGLGTQLGVILGTAAYMSPEQAKGRVVDKRSDVWAFGCVLFEMLTGRRVFDGEDVSDTLAAVLRSEPDWTRLPDQVPADIRALLKRCLQRDRTKRVTEIGVARYVLESVDTAQGEERRAGAPGQRWRATSMWLSLAAAVGLTTGAIVWWLEPTVPEHHLVTRFVYSLPEDQNSTFGGLAPAVPGRAIASPVDAAISADGRQIVYCANQRLYLRAMDQLDAQPIPGTDENPTQPMFSPDGQSIVYFVSLGSALNIPTTLKKISVSGGTPVPLAQAPSLPYGASWHGDTIVFAVNTESRAGIQAVPSTGGAPTTIIEVNPKAEVIAQPELLPDGKHVVFVVRPAARGGAYGDIVVQALPNGERKVLVANGTSPRLLPTGQLVYLQTGTLFAAPFDFEQLKVGVPSPMVGNVAAIGPVLAGMFWIASAEGSLAYSPTNSAGATATLVWVTRQGEETPIPAEARAYRFPRLSPDGTKIAVDTTDQEKDVWVFDLAKHSPTRISFGPAQESSPVWMSDNRRLLFVSGTDVIRKAIDGTGKAETVARNPPGGYLSSLSPDGKSVMSRTGGGAVDVLMTIPLDGSREPQPLLDNNGSSQRNAEISPNGRWIAYDSNESGRSEVYVRPFPNVNAERWKISTEGGYVPMWARSGEELFFVQPTGKAPLMSVKVQAGSSFTYDKPHRLFDTGSYLTRYWFRAFDISPDGQRFVFVKPAGADSTTRPSIVVVSHWSDEVRARLGAK
jgi:serine/threonine-protein kinase